MLCALLAVTTRVGAVEPAEGRASASNYGTAGLLEMPNARSFADGELVLTAAFNELQQRYALTFQALPFLQGTFRYTIWDEFNGGTDTLYDRSFDLKLRLIRESRVWPEIAVGLQDFLGTGFFSGEYVVATRRFAAFDVTFGLGWGRVGSRDMFKSPLSVFHSGFEERDAETDIEDTGRPSFDSYFSGPASLFGGIEYLGPIEGMRIKAEYSGDVFRRERDTGDFDYEWPVNLGLFYRPLSWFEIGAEWLFGASFGLRASMDFGLSEAPPLPKFDPPPTPVRIRSPQEVAEAAQTVVAGTPAWQVLPPTRQAETDAAATATAVDAMFDSLAALGYDLVDFTMSGESASIVLAPTSADIPPFACSESAVRMVAAKLPQVQTALFVTEMPGAEPARCRAVLHAPTPARPPRTIMVAAPAPAPVIATAVPTSAWWSDPAAEKDIAERVTAALTEAGFPVEAIDLDQRIARVYFVNPTYPRPAQAYGRVARILTQMLPPSVEMFELVTTTTSGLHLTRLRVSRREIERLAQLPYPAAPLLRETDGDSAPGELPADAYRNPDFLPSYTFAVAPALRHNLMDPDDPYRFQFYARVGFEAHLIRNLTLTSRLGINIFNQLDEIERESDSELPHVRSDFREYFDEGENGINRLGLDYIWKPQPEVWARLSAGYFEEMFGGFGAEVLYKPSLARWAIGGDLNQVWQRDFDMRFDFRDYEVLTGHGSLYYEWPYYGMQTNVHAGRYLAKDWGATFEVMRRLNSGAVVGAFATFTDVSFDEYGEGSFDKGIFLTLPLDMLTPFSTRRRVGVTIRPVTRDGGQRLWFDKRLYPIASSDDFQSTLADWGAFIE